MEFFSDLCTHFKTKSSSTNDCSQCERNGLHGSDHSRVRRVFIRSQIIGYFDLFRILQSGNAFFICDFHWPEHLLRMYLEQLQPAMLIYLHDEEKVIVTIIRLFLDFYHRQDHLDQYE